MEISMVICGIPSVIMYRTIHFMVGGCRRMNEKMVS